MSQQQNSGLQVGDVVRLKSGGPSMTVEKVDLMHSDSGSSYCCCVWFNRSQPVRNNYPQRALEKVKSDTVQVGVEAPAAEPEAATTTLTCSRADCRRRIDLGGDCGEDGYAHRCAACDQLFCENHIAPGDHGCVKEGREAESEVARRMREVLEGTGGEKGE